VGAIIGVRKPERPAAQELAGLAARNKLLRGTV
jgi:hypothetical protein